MAYKFAYVIFLLYLCSVNSRWGVCIDVSGEGADIFKWRLLTLVFDLLKPRKLQKSQTILKTRRSRCSWVYNTPACTI